MNELSTEQALDFSLRIRVGQLLPVAVRVACRRGRHYQGPAASEYLQNVTKCRVSSKCAPVMHSVVCHPCVVQHNYASHMQGMHTRMMACKVPSSSDWQWLSLCRLRLDSSISRGKQAPVWQPQTHDRS